MLVAAVALPAVGGAGMTVNAAADELVFSPGAREPPLAEKTTLLDANGKQFAQFYFENRESVKLDEVADVMKTAIVAIEDFRFYEHGAIDLEGTFRAAVKNVSGGGVVQGGSSITQQYVKLVLVNAAETKEEQAAAIAPTLSRKLNELRYALAIEEKYTKPEILERYLNISYYGAGAYGIQAASRRFFNKPASKLALWEAATLAGAVQNPSVTDPSAGKASRDRLLERRNIVLTGWPSSARSRRRRPRRPRRRSSASRTSRPPAAARRAPTRTSACTCGRRSRSTRTSARPASSARGCCSGAAWSSRRRSPRRRRRPRRRRSRSTSRPATSRSPRRR